jgi:hypothetical protein
VTYGRSLCRERVAASWDPVPDVGYLQYSKLRINFTEARRRVTYKLIQVKHDGENSCRLIVLAASQNTWQYACTFTSNSRNLDRFEYIKCHVKQLSHVPRKSPLYHDFFFSKHFHKSICLLRSEEYSRNYSCTRCKYKVVARSRIVLNLLFSSQLGRWKSLTKSFPIYHEMEHNLRLVPPETFSARCSSRCGTAEVGRDWQSPQRKHRSYLIFFGLCSKEKSMKRGYTLRLEATSHSPELNPLFPR